MNGNDGTKRYPRIVEEAGRVREPLIIDAEVVCLDGKGVPSFDTLDSRVADESAVALAFGGFLLSSEDIRRQPLIERKTALKWVLRKLERAFSMLNMLRATATNFLPPFAISGLRTIMAISTQTVPAIPGSARLPVTTIVARLS